MNDEIMMATDVAEDVVEMGSKLSLDKKTLAVVGGVTLITLGGVVVCVKLKNGWRPFKKNKKIEDIAPEECVDEPEEVE